MYVLFMCMCHMCVSAIFGLHVWPGNVSEYGAVLWASLWEGYSFYSAHFMDHVGYQGEAGFSETRLECEVSACEDHGLKPSMPRGH